MSNAAVSRRDQITVWVCKDISSLLWKSKINWKERLVRSLLRYTQCKFCYFSIFATGVIDWCNENYEKIKSRFLQFAASRTWFTSPVRSIVKGSIMFWQMGQLMDIFFLKKFQVRLQTQPKNAPLYSGVMDCAKKTVAKEVCCMLWFVSSLAETLVKSHFPIFILFLRYLQCIGIFIQSN